MSLNEKLKKSFKKKSNVQKFSTSHNNLDNVNPNQGDSGHSSMSSNFEFDICSTSSTSTSSSDSDRVTIRNNSCKEKSLSKLEDSSQDNNEISINIEDSDYSSFERKKARPKSIIQKIKNVFITKDKHKNLDLPHSSLNNSSSIPEELNIINEDLEINPTDNIFESPTEDCEDNVGPSYSTSLFQSQANLDLQIESDAETLKNEDQNCSTDDEYIEKEIIGFDEKKVEISTKFSDDDIWSFISDPTKHNITLIGKIISTLQNTEICSLYEENGYDQSIITFIVVESVLNGNLSNEIQKLLLSYRTLNERRLQDSQFYESFSKISPLILTIQNRLDSIVKIRTINSLKCLKCKKEDVSLLYLPCGHIVLCGKCKDIINDSCECCGSKIQEFHQIFL